ncbi:hypothetical protein L914_00389 [Phytophthora nicotianae]|uniref:Uncharacterized protein n=1 Tax=Phytophthora nicotianae TaxID=4792 RepID=W2P906_PHYNI|nr:hypothetical protein L914_00389 [Phytophthora nicotianae]
MLLDARIGAVLGVQSNSCTRKALPRLHPKISIQQDDKQLATRHDRQESLRNAFYSERSGYICE